MNNVQSVPALSPLCPYIEEGQKTSLSGEKTDNIYTVPSCPPLSSIKDIIKKVLRGVVENDNSIINNKENWGDRGDSAGQIQQKSPLTLSKTPKSDVSPCPMNVEQPRDNHYPPDSRLKDTEFKESVRIVLEHFGLESNFGNFKKHDAKYGGLIRDWQLFADRILHPRFTAIVQVIGSDAEIGIDLPGIDRQEALNKLDTKCYKFKKWF